MISYIHIHPEFMSFSKIKKKKSLTVPLSQLTKEGIKAIQLVRPIFTFSLFECISYLQLRALSLAPAVGLEVVPLGFVVGFVVGFLVGVVGSAERLH